MKNSTLVYDKAMHEARKYWRDRIDAMSFGGHIALDHPRPRDAEPRTTSLERPLAPEVHALLRRLSGGNPFLVYTALVSALKICCHKYSGEREVTVFSPALSESTESTAAALLPVSGTLDGSSTFKDVLLATKDRLSGAFRHHQYPFSRMLMDLPEERKPGHLPMIAAMVGFNEEIPETPCDITVLFEAAEDRTKATFRFDARVHEESTILRFFEFFDGLLQQCLSAPATRIADLGSASPPESEGADLQDLRLHRLIEMHAAKHPEHVAVVERGEHGRATTYGTLNDDAERLAGMLTGLPLDVRKPVVILVDAGTEMIVSMLAVLKTGAAFTTRKLLSTGGGPVDGVLDALDSQCILCQPEQVADLQRFTAGRLQHVVTVEYPEDPEGSTAPSFQIACHGSASQAGVVEGAAPADPDGGGIACVIADGRDGGRPSPVTHAELAGLFQWLNGRCGIGPGDRCLLSSALGASEQLYDTLGMLSAGGTVEIVEIVEIADAARLAERLLAPPVTVWDLPTPLAQNLLGNLLTSRAERPHLRGPRNIFLSGEKQCLHLAEKLARCFPDARITGLYAHPAAGIWTTFFPLREEDSEEPRRTVTARAIAGFEHQVLNRSGEPAPLYTKGELHLRRSASGPLLKTGLRAEARGRGRLAWLRGEDHCFFKNGCSVELTEIEAALCQHEHIRAAEVIAVKPDQSADPVVVAFVLAGPEQPPAEAIADSLVRRGDCDLIPDRFILLDELPLTANGAVDREELAARFVTSREGEVRGLVADDIQRQLREIWVDVLQEDDVTDSGSFFTEGGNSIKAALLIARIRDEFSVNVPVLKFFRAPNIRAVAQLIAAESANAGNLEKGPDFKIVSRERYRVQLPELES